MAQLIHESRAGRSRRAGFSLIEVMVAMAILGVGLLAIAGAQLHAMQGGRSGRHTSTASLLAQAKMEELQRARWTSIPAAAWQTTPVNVQVDDGGGAQVEQAYNVSWRITDLVLGQTRALDVRVTWNEPNRPNRIVTYSSVRFNREGL